MVEKLINFSIEVDRSILEKTAIDHILDHSPSTTVIKEEVVAVAKPVLLDQTTQTEELKVIEVSESESEEEPPVQYRQLKKISSGFHPDEVKQSRTDATVHKEPVQIKEADKVDNKI